LVVFPDEVPARKKTERTRQRVRWERNKKTRGTGTPETKKPPEKKSAEKKRPKNKIKGLKNVVENKTTRRGPVK